MHLKGIDLSLFSDAAAQLKLNLWAIDYSNGSPCCIYSDSIQALLGYSSEELTGLAGGITSLINDEDKQKTKIKLTNIQNDNSIEHAELIYRFVAKGNENIWIKEKLYIERDNSGKVERTLSIAFEIDDVKEENEQLIESLQKLTEMNSIKDKFISIVSHDLRAPFTTLLGFTEILLTEEDLPVEERDEYLNYIYDASKSQLQMINYLVEWSRLQTGRVKIEPSRLNVKDIISNCVSTLTGVAMRKDLEIKTIVPLELYVNADDRLISQAISNLISNAIKFSESGKKIEISANRFKDGKIEVVVKDEGIGIAEENMPKLFKIDFKYSIPGTKGEKGTGLGLALVKEIIEKHDGDIWFYSKVNEGSEFHFTILEAKNIIMLVEDDEKQRKDCKKTIEKAFPDFEIIEAENGYKALNIAQKKIPSLIIINHDMPLMDGIQFIETIRGKNTLKNIPLIVLTDNVEDEILKKYSELKIEQIISKTDDLDKLTMRIKEIII